MTETKNDYIKLLKERMIKIFEEDKNLYLSKDEQGMYYSKICVDYGDSLCEETVKKIMQSDHPLDYFYEFINEVYLQEEFRYEEEVLNILEKDEEIQRLVGLIDYSLVHVLREIFYVNYPYEYFLNEDVQVDIIVDTGDLNYDYTLNCVYPHYNGTRNEEIEDAASIVWLTKQQGYTKADLENALYNKTYKDSKYLKSLVSEVANCTSCMNALVFCVEMSLKKLIELNERIDNERKLNGLKERKGTDFIKIEKSVVCGLYDCWNGAGSMLDIELEKDVELPIEYIDTALPDGARGYGINNIYGVLDIWKYGKVV